MSSHSGNPSKRDKNYEDIIISKGPIHFPKPIGFIHHTLLFGGTKTAYVTIDGDIIEDNENIIIPPQMFHALY